MRSGKVLSGKIFSWKTHGANADCFTLTEGTIIFLGLFCIIGTKQLLLIQTCQLDSYFPGDDFL